MVHFRFTTIIVIVHRDFYRVIYSVRVCIPHYGTCYFCDNRMSKVRYRIASGIISGKYIGFVLNGREDHHRRRYLDGFVNVSGIG